jgi:hypothetical protein
MTRMATGLAVAAVAMGLLTGCSVSFGASGESTDTPVNPPATAAPTDPAQVPPTPEGPGATTPPETGATAPESALPENAGGFIRDYDAEQREANLLRSLQNEPPPAGPKYSLGPLMAGIYNVYGETTRENELLVLRAEGQFPDTGAAMTDFTERIRSQGAELTPVDAGELGGSAGCTPRTAAEGGTVTVCYLVDSTTLILIQGHGSIPEVSDALKRMHPSLKA